MTWTREHDKVLAERCCGLEVDGDQVVIRSLDTGEGWHTTCRYPLPRYNFDAGACGVAAEAWRLQKPGRRYEVVSAYVDGWLVDGGCASLFDGNLGCVSIMPTLHEALYEAVKDE